MEQSATSSSTLLASATEDEIIVFQILLDLRTLMSLSESLSNCKWGRRRRRSCLERPPPLTSGPSLPENRIEEKRTPIKAEEAALQDEKHCGGARTTASPDTPLSFSPTESDEKPKYSLTKSSKKRSKEDCLHMIEGLTQGKELLSGEIQNVKKYYNKLKAYNSKLKAMKQEAFNSGLLRREESEMVLSQHYRMHWEPHHHHNPLVADPTVQYGSGPVAAHLQPSDYGIGLGTPLGIDLNLPAEEAFGGVDLYRPLDAAADKRARSAEARRKRIGIIKTKSSGSAL